MSCAVNKQRAKQQSCRSTAYCPVDFADVVQGQLRSQQVVVTFRTCCKPATCVQKWLKGQAFQYSSSQPHINSMKTAIARAKASLLASQCPGRSQRHGLARSSSGLSPSAQRASCSSPPVSPWQQSESRRPAEDTIEESGWVPTRNKADINVPRVNSRSKQRVLHACKQRDEWWWAACWMLWTPWMVVPEFNSVASDHAV